MNASRGARDRMVAMPGIMEEYLPNELRGRPKDFFTYSTSFLPLAAGASASQTIQINSDSHFLIVMAALTARLDVAAATFSPDPPLTAEIQTSGSGRLFQNEPTDVRNVFGSAELPGILPYPKVIDGGSTVTVRLASLGTADLNIRVAFLGLKIYPPAR